ncbi:hypothetical protein BDF14DRAFT_1469891 [Spinellus fusiger]|nr:hypothetical protein BDF14DRAFT_1469891 [Spinellus fusiger]
MTISFVTNFVFFILFLINYSLTLTALIVPKWVSFVIPVPIYYEKSYGLFRECNNLSGSCIPFPRGDQKACEEEGFCELWHASAAGMVLAAVVGGLTVLALLGALCGGRMNREKAWKGIACLFVLGAIPQAFSMGVIAYLFNTSAFFYIGARYNVSFVLCIVSWCLNVLLAVILSMIGVLSPPSYSYMSIH